MKRKRILPLLLCAALVLSLLPCAALAAEPAQAQSAAVSVPDPSELSAAPKSNAGALVNYRGGESAPNWRRILLESFESPGRSEGMPEYTAIDGEGGNARPRDFTAAAAAAQRLKELGLFRGVGTNPDGSTNFDLERSLLRTEALVMLIRLLGKEDEALSGKWKHPFTDVPQWADKYIGYAYEKKLTNGISATKFGTGAASSRMYLTFVLRALNYSDAAGADFEWDSPERLAASVGILPEGVDTENFLRADVVLISEAALSAKLKNSSTTLLEKLISQEDDKGPQYAVPVWTDVYSREMRLKTADELYFLIYTASINLVPEFEIRLANEAYDEYFEGDDKYMTQYVNLGSTYSEYDYQTESFSIRIEYSVYLQLQGLIFNRGAVESYVSKEVKDYDAAMRAILDKIITPGMTDRQKVKAVHDYMVVNYKYDTEYESGKYGDETYAFHGLLKNGTGVCQAYAELFYILMCYEDIECYFVPGLADGGTGEYGLHAWNVVYVDGGYYHVDVTFDDPVPDRGGAISYRYFLKTDEEMKKDHVW